MYRLPARSVHRGALIAATIGAIRGRPQGGPFYGLKTNDATRVFRASSCVLNLPGGRGCQVGGVSLVAELRGHRREFTLEDLQFTGDSDRPDVTRYRRAGL